MRAERKVASAGAPANNSGGESLNGTLTGPEVEAWLENGYLKVVEARKQPVFESSSSGRLEASETIRIEPAGLRAGSLRTQGTSRFTREGLAIDGSNFTITVKDDANEQVFNTTARATLTSAGLTTRANTTNAHFDTKAKTLTSMLQTGNVTFNEDKGGRKGSSGKLTIRDGGNRIEMEEGSPEFNDAQGTLYASRITLDRQAESFTGEGGGAKIRMISSGAGSKPVVLRARRVEGRLGGENPRVDYTGDAEMYPPDGSQIEAAKLTLFPKDKRVEAEGKVRSVAPDGQEVSAERLQFRNSGEGPQVAYYKGGVRVDGDFAAPKSDKQAAGKKTHLTLRSDDLELHSRDGNLERILAAGKVQMDRGSQKGRGTSLEYNVATGAIRLLGTNASPAEVTGRQGYRAGLPI